VEPGRDPGLRACADEAWSAERPLAGQHALVTGAATGIGAAIARYLAAAGACVVVNYRANRDDAMAVVDRIGAAGGSALALQADVSDEPAVESLFAAITSELGGIDILVNNAGIQRDAPLVDMSLGDWREVIDVNLTAQFLCARAAARAFLADPNARGRSTASGKIICISSVHDVIPWAGHVNYAVSKAGVAMLVRTLAQELAPQRVRVNGISPGAIRTAINREAWQTFAAARELVGLIPYGRIGDPDDVARAAAWLASDRSDYVTGTMLYVDGGMTLYPAFREGG
jgi:glucose 1-dehydrogenase